MGVMRSAKNKNISQEIDDIAFDIGLEHQWVEGNKWKGDEFKDKAYKLAELEAKKYSKGGEIRDFGTGIDWLITGK